MPKPQKYTDTFILTSEVFKIFQFRSKKKVDKNIDCIPKKNHPQRFKGLLLGVNPFLSFFAILATILAIFGKIHTSNFPAQYRIDHLLLRISQIQSVQSILLQHFT